MPTPNFESQITDFYTNAYTIVEAVQLPDGEVVNPLPHDTCTDITRCSSFLVRHAITGKFSKDPMDLLLGSLKEGQILEEGYTANAQHITIRAHLPNATEKIDKFFFEAVQERHSATVTHDHRDGMLTIKGSHGTRTLLLGASSEALVRHAVQKELPSWFKADRQGKNRDILSNAAMPPNRVDDNFKSTDTIAQWLSLTLKNLETVLTNADTDYYPLSGAKLL